MLQCSFAGRSVRHASRGLIIASMITGVLTLSYIIPGICGQLIYADNPLGMGDSILPKLLVDVLPIGIGGLIVAGLVAASNSTASALLTALATLAENDLFRRFVPGKTSRQYLWFGRGTLVAGGLLGILFSFYVDKVGIIRANFDIMSVFEPPIFVIVAGALFWRRSNSFGATAAMVGGIGFGALAAIVFKVPAETRTFLSFPICIALMGIGSWVGALLRPRSEAEGEQIDTLLARSRGVDRQPGSRNGVVGLGVAVVSLVAFILFAVFEEILPRPGNLFAFMGSMLAFVMGCYIAVPAFMPDAKEGQEQGTSAIEGSMIQKVLGSGWAWLVVCVSAILLVTILYVN